MHDTVKTTEGSNGDAVKLTRKDFVSDQEVRWCPGCGDYSILATMQRLMPQLGHKKEDVVFVSGIGCSSRFPYYMNTYGFHSIHGRAPSVATGVKLTNPDLSVWVITGDGDGLSIGGNHLLHVMRRNLDVNIILFNNRIYGLTKGQYSPTSEFGKKTKSSPFGALDYPLNPIKVAISAEATWIGRSIDVDAKHLSEMITAMDQHRGVSFLEVYQNCNIFNDGAFEDFVNRKVRADRTVHLEDGKPIVFGADNDKGIRLNPEGLPEVVDIGKDGPTDDLLVHNAANPNAGVAFTLSEMGFPDFPVPVGVFRNIQRPTYDRLVTDQISDATERQGAGQLEKLLHGADTWTVE